MGERVDQAQLRERVSKVSWFHSIDLGDGLTTPGAKRPEVLKVEAEEIFGGLELAGRSVLDVGAWNGFFSFEAKRRGAKRVVACDHFTWSSGAILGKEGFDLARATLGLDIEDRQLDVHDLSVERVGTFDVVLFLGVLYHLFDPIEALSRLASIASDLLVVETQLDAHDLDRPAMVFYPRRELAGDYTNWWAPNRECVEELLRSLGFVHIQVTPHPTESSRAIFHAWRQRFDGPKVVYPRDHRWLMPSSRPWAPPRPLRQQLEALKAENEQLKAQLSRIGATRPSLRGAVVSGLRGLRDLLGPARS